MATSTRTSAATDPRRTAGDAVQAMTGAVGDAAAEAGARLPEAAAATRDALADAGRTIRSGSDERLSAGTLLSFSFALGLLIGGANRLLVLLALVPAAAMGITLLDRQAMSPRRTAPTNGR